MPPSPSWRNKQIIFIALAVLVVALVALVFLYYRRPAWPNPPKPQFPPLVAPAGKLTPGFPKELILDDKARLGASFAINYNANLNQYTASFYSQETMVALFADYKSYFKKNNWTSTNEVVKYPASRGLYAKKGSSDASVAIADRGGSREVIITYVAK